MKKSIMKFVLSSLAVFAAMGIGGVASAQDVSQKVYRGQEQQSFVGASETFSGDVRVQMLFPTNATTQYGGAYVTFAQGARSAWHTHPAGQQLVVVKGICWTQEWNGKRIEARPGDTIWCPSGVKHWHGASTDGEMTHLALTGVSENGANVEWLEKVTDLQYYGK